jgi:hypothetical protein
MKKRLLFFFIFWMVLFILGYFYLYNRSILDPSFCFNKQDDRVVIVSDKRINIDTLLKDQSIQLYNLLCSRITFKKAFLSTNKPKILLKFDHELSKTNIERIYSRLELSFVKERNFYKLDNKWKCYFKKNALFFIKGKFKNEDSKLIFNHLNSDFSILDVSKNNISNFYIKEKYFKKYQTAIQNNLYKNVSDFELFSNYIPIGVEDYTFFEKDFALKNNVLEKGIAFEKIINSGFCVFSFEGKKIIIADIKENVDPYLILDQDVGRKEIVPGLRKNYQGIYFSTNASKLNEECFIEVLDDKLIISQNQKDFDILLDLLENKKTLNRNTNEINFIFNRFPKRVIYRGVTEVKNEAVVSNNDRLVSYIKIEKILNQIHEKTFPTISNVLSIKSGQKNIYIFTNSEIIKMNENSISLSVKYKGVLKGEPVVYEENNQDKIFFTTSEKLYLIDENFDNLNGYPIILKSEPLLPFYRYGPNKLIGLSKTNFISISDSLGNVKKRIKTDFKNQTQQFYCFNTNIDLGVVYDRNKVYFIEIENPKLVNMMELQNSSSVFLISQNSQAFFYIKNSKLIRNGFQGELFNCANGNNLRQLKAYFEMNLVSVLSNSSIALFDVDGKCISKIKLPNKSISSYDVIKNSKGESFVILTNELTKDNYIYTFDGNEIFDKPVKGDKLFLINRIGRNFEIFVSSNNKLIKYIK